MAMPPCLCPTPSAPTRQVLLVVSGTLIYFIESAAKPDSWFDSIPLGMWYMHVRAGGADGRRGGGRMHGRAGRSAATPARHAPPSSRA
jgi:hypothetical protein